jgi:hypothetical protein
LSVPAGWEAFQVSIAFVITNVQWEIGMSTPDSIAGRYAISMNEVCEAIGRALPLVYKEINEGRLKTFRPSPNGQQYIRVANV